MFGRKHRGHDPLSHNPYVWYSSEWLLARRTVLECHTALRTPEEQKELRQIREVLAARSLA